MQQMSEGTTVIQMASGQLKQGIFYLFACFSDRRRDKESSTFFMHLHSFTKDIQQR